MAMLSRGSRGENVRKLQEALKSASFPVTIDGVYGAKTEAAVRMFQDAVGLTPDGIAGNATLSALEMFNDFRRVFVECLTAIESLPEFKRVEELLK